jgi:hypothetical protein
MENQKPEKMNKKIFAIPVLTAAILFLAGCGGAGIPGAPGPAGDSLVMAVFQDGVYPSAAYAGTSDAYIESGAASGNNYGSSDTLYAGYDGASGGSERSVLRFDVSGLSSQPIFVKRAYLTLYASQRVSLTDFSVSAYRLLASWTEGDVTWDDSSAGVLWAAPGGNYSAAASSDSVLMNTVNAPVTFTLDQSMVQGWIDSPQSNYGIILVSTAESGASSNWYGFVSKDNTLSPGLRPRLTVYYAIH